jgi:cytochrome c
MRVVLSFLLLLIFGLSVVQAASLHDAAREGDVAAIAVALDAGADINADDGGTALYIAARRGHLEAVRLLIERGADVNGFTKFGTALSAAVSKSRIEVVRLLLEKDADPNLQFNGDNMLHVAARGTCLACLKALVDAGADVNEMNRNGETPLHLALRLSIPKMAEILVANGVILPKPAPISDKLATADVGEGEAIFVRRCSTCHTAQKGNGTGHHIPGMWGIVGRAKASQGDVTYSAALKAWEGPWTYEDLNTYLYAPKATTPGVMTEFPGLPLEADRINLIGYLRNLSDAPLPLP